MFRTGPKNAFGQSGINARCECCSQPEYTVKIYSSRQTFSALREAILTVRKSSYMASETSDVLSASTPND
jgi:hypothetical protein